MDLVISSPVQKAKFLSFRTKFTALLTILLLAAPLSLLAQPVQISDWFGLDDIRNNLSGSFELVNDLDESTPGYAELAGPNANGGEGWEPIGTFQGDLNGNGHEISGLYINRPEDSDQGLFFAIGTNGEISDLIISNADITAFVVLGILAGQNFGQISNVEVSGVLVGVGDIGGIVGGQAQTGEITGSRSFVEILRTPSDQFFTIRFGGIVGTNDGFISKTFFEGFIKGDDEIGGITGINIGSISDTYALGSIETQGETGGIVGHNSGIITRTYSTVTIEPEFPINTIGVLVGVNTSSADLSDSYWNSEITGSATGVGTGDDSGAEGLTNAQMRDPNSFEDWDFDTVWKVSAAEGTFSFPFLQENPQDPPPGFLNFFPGGDGTPENPWQIALAEHLDLIRDFPADHFELVNDIDLTDWTSEGNPGFNSGRGWRPIPGFSGSLNGNSFAVSNLFMNRPDENQSGLFSGISSGAVISNLSLLDVDVTTSFASAVLVGVSSGTIENVHITGDFAAQLTAGTGSIVGFMNSSGAITGSSAKTSITNLASSNEPQGGLVGENSGTISESAFLGSFSGTRAGGIAGINFGTIRDCFVFASADVSNQASGIADQHSQNAAIERCHAYLIPEGSGSVNGVVRNTGGSSTITDVYWVTDTGATSGVGTGLSVSEMLDENSFSGFDFGESGPWEIIQDFGFPFLKNTGIERVVVSVLEGTQGWRTLGAPSGTLSYSEVFSEIWLQGFPDADYFPGMPNIYTWNEQNRTFEPPSSALDVPERGKGIAAFVFQDDEFGVPGEFPKTLLNAFDEQGGTVDLPVSLTFSGPGDSFVIADDGWNLVANPYSFPIDWDSPEGWSRSGLMETIYIWDNNLGPNGNYREWNGFAGTLGGGKIAPGQAFWVKANNTDSPELTIDEQAGADTANFYRSPIDTPETPLISMELHGDETHSSTILMLHPEASVGHDSFDSIRLQPLTEDHLSLFTLGEDSIPLVIQALSDDLSGEHFVPLGISGTKMQGEFELSWTGTAIPEGWVFSLFDTETGQSADLTMEGSYSFTMDEPLRKMTSADEAFAKPVPAVLSTDESVTGRFVIHVEPGVPLSTGETDLPRSISLSQNYPNPFNPSTIIRYELPEAEHVSLEVFDITGRRVATLLNNPVEAGVHEVSFDGRHLSSGVYLYRLQTPQRTITRKMMLVK